MIPFGPFCEESVMKAMPSLLLLLLLLPPLPPPPPRRRSNRTSLRYVVGRATSCEKRIFLMTLSAVRSMQTSLGPPYLVGWNIGLPVSRIHRRSAGSTTTDCTDTSAAAGSYGSI